MMIFMNIFKQRTLLVAGAISAMIAVTSGCAKETSVDTSGMAKAYVQAWMSVNHPEASQKGLGVYILQDTPGTGEALTDDDFYVFADYTSTDLDGTISSTTFESVSQQLGTYNAANYYGNDILMMGRGYTQVGLLEMIDGMRVGGTRTAMIPGWLNVYDDYETAEEYERKSSGTNTIYTITITGKTADITAWEVDTLQRYVARNMDAVDSTKFGYYHKTLKDPTSTEVFTSDSVFCINYTGRLLNGHVFDTTIEDTAKVHGIYSASKSYSPMYVTIDSEDYTKTTIAASNSEEGSTVVDGFAYCLSKMRPDEKVICAFYSGLGYGYSGSGSSIPKFAPIVFEIEAVADPGE